MITRTVGFGCFLLWVPGLTGWNQTPAQPSRVATAKSAATGPSWRQLEGN